MDEHEKCFTAGMLALLITLLMMMLSGCAGTRIVQMPAVTHDTICTNIVRVDTFNNTEREYVNVFTAGDTVYKVREVTRWREHTSIKHDTLFIHKTGSVSVPVPVERKLTFWERQERNIKKMGIAVLGYVAVVLLVAWVVRRFARKQ